MASAQITRLPSVNKQIVEIKKRIQLTDGQRKSLFEEIESKRKKHSEEIDRLKKDISKLIVELHVERTAALKSKVPIVEVEAIVGHVGDKTSSEVVESLDLYAIDRTKKVDLLNYNIKKKEELLTKLAKEYQKLLIDSSAKQSKGNIRDSRIITEIKNKINAVEVKIREAEHVRCRYREIHRSLTEDAARFESKLSRVSKELMLQESEISKLEKVNVEASKLRVAARNNLLREEKQVIAAGILREKQTAEGKRLVKERKQELEKLEKRFYQGPKQQIRNDAEEDSPKERETPSPCSDPMQLLAENFERLKNVTGGTCIEEVLEKFRAQKETQKRLTELRQNLELVKGKLEKKQEKCNAELETLKFIEAKDIEQNAEALENMNDKIVAEKNKKLEIQMKTESTEALIKTIAQKLQSIYISFDRSRIERDPFKILEYLNGVVNDAVRQKNMERLQVQKVDTIEVGDEKWLPLPYGNIIRRTPLPQHTSPTPTAPPGSDEEEEVPSRGFLKRQAHLVVDAKLKRKNLKFQTAKLK